MNGVFSFHLGMTPKEVPLLIVYFKLLLHKFSFNGLRRQKYKHNSKRPNYFAINVLISV